MKKLLIGLFALGSFSAFAFECESTASNQRISLATNSVVTSSFIKHQILTNDTKISYYGSFNNFEGNRSISLEVALIKNNSHVGSELVDLDGVGSKKIILDGVDVEITCL